MSEQDKKEILEVKPELAAAAERLIPQIQEGKVLLNLAEPEAQPINIYDLPEDKQALSYEPNPENPLMREKDGTMLLNKKVKDVQKRAVKTVLGQVAKKILSANLTGLNLPIFLFQPFTYLHT